MWLWINETVKKFENNFSRKTTFCWFVIILLGLMLRSDHLGISSIVRELGLVISAYPAMLHFFRSEGWQLEGLKYTWLKIITAAHLAVKIAGRYIITGDGIKGAKEGRKIPGVKSLHQESDNSSKGEYIHGHFYGGLGILVSNGSKLYNILLSLRLHDGIAALREWFRGDEYNEESHVVKMIRDAAWAVRQLGESILLLDRLYLTKPMLLALAETSGLSVVSKAKSNATAYYPPGPYKGRGARAKKGPSVKVADFFSTSVFTACEMTLYGKEQVVQFFSIDLLWSRGLYYPLRFVLTVFADGKKSILASTDLTLKPEQIINLYCHRFKIECSFRELKQVIAGFSYHFWSKAMPKLKKFKNNEINHENLKNVSDPGKRKLIESTVKAIEGYVQISVIALGFLQLLGLLFGQEINSNSRRFMRTVSSVVPSERTVADFMRKNIYMLFRFFPELPLTTIIKERQSVCFDNDLERVS